MDLHLVLHTKIYLIYLGHKYRVQCQKLRVHPAPGVHISAAGCTIFGGVHPECAPFFKILLLLYIRRVHGENPGA